MIFKYDKRLKKITQFQETDLRSHGIFERQDIEKWVENSPEILGEDLLIITTEYDKFDKTSERLDLLAVDRLGKLAVIELKRDDSGKAVELQAIKYAAYCSTLTLDDAAKLFSQYLLKKGEIIEYEEAKSRLLNFIENDEFEELDEKPRIILVSKEFRPEVTSSVLWLRKFGVDISCVKLTPYELGPDSISFESAILIPLPEAGDFIIKSERKENVGHLSLSQQEYINFYRDLIIRIRAALPISFQDPTARSYYQIQTGISGFHFEWAFHGRPRSSFAVELHFEKGNKKLNKEAIDQMKLRKADTENQTGESVIIQEDWGKSWARLYVEKGEGKMTEELKSWAVKNMLIFYGLLKPDLDKIRR